MPNHIVNEIKFLNIDKKKAEEINSKILDSDGYLDFSLIIPLPAILITKKNYTCPSAERIATSMFKDKLSKEDAYKKCLFADRLENDRISQDVDEYYKAISECGYTNSMEFARSEWGTKWGAYGQYKKQNASKSILFKTAWNAPAPIYEALSKMFSDIEILFKFADEDIGCNLGEFVLLNGNPVRNHDKEILPIHGDIVELRKFSRNLWKKYNRTHKEGA